MVGTSRGSANLGPKVFFIWGSLCFLSLLFAYFIVPEMKGLSLEQVDKMLEEVSPRKSPAWIPTTTFAEEMRRINAAKATRRPDVPSLRVHSPVEGIGKQQQFPMQTYQRHPSPSGQSKGYQEIQGYGPSYQEQGGF